MLSDRRQQVLCALIEEYIARALPVGSKTLMDNYGLGVSSATIRNELSSLEQLGYISQPHTSAGRVPTDSGYRAFVDHLLEDSTTDNRPEYEFAVSQLQHYASEADDLLEKTSVALSRMTDCLSIVLAPSVLNAKLKQISLISFSDYHVLIVVVTDDGQVFNRHVDLPFSVDVNELARVQNLLNDVLLGKSLQEVEDGLAKGVQYSNSDPVLRRLLAEVLHCLQESNKSQHKRMGLSALLTKPEFAQSSSIVPVLQVLEDETVLLEIVEDVLHSETNPTIRIGNENVNKGLAGVSMVAAQYGGDSNGGIVAVIGPTRMDYSRAIAAIKAARQNLEDR